MRFELLIDARCRGYVEYYLFNHVVIVTHTEIDPRWEGNGYGSRLARQALDYFSSESKHVVPVCGFFAHQIRRHPEYANLVTMECRRIFDL
jgi:predicted GNAT family acetyltransferase